MFKWDRMQCNWEANGKNTYFCCCCTGGKKENTTTNNGKTLLNNPKAQAAGAAILSAVTSPQAAGLIQPQQQSMGANGFNRGELVEFLNMRK